MRWWVCVGSGRMMRTTGEWLLQESESVGGTILADGRAKVWVGSACGCVGLDSGLDISLLLSWCMSARITLSSPAKARVFPYIFHHPHRWLQGLGKTAQTISFLGVLRTLTGNRSPHLVVCPASLIQV